MFKQVIVVLMLSFRIFSCLGNNIEKLTSEESLILDAFFRVLFEKDGAGYVLFDSKPVCWTGFQTKDLSRPYTMGHKESVIIREGINIWEKLNSNENNIVIQSYDKNSPFDTNSCDLLIINRFLFLKTVKKNLSLFQYVLGPQITPKKFLDAFLTSDDLISLIKNDRVLIGILLGFGTFNAIAESRLENIYEAQFNHSDIPPFEKKLVYTPEFTLNQKEFLFFSGDQNLSPVKTSCYPSFDFNSLEEEYHSLGDKMSISPPSLLEEPSFIFGYLKNCSKTQELIKKLENTQSKLQALIKSPTFLADVLKSITGKTFLIELPKQNQIDIENHELSQINLIIAKNVWNQIRTSDSEYVEEFLNHFGKCAVLKNEIRCGFFPDHYQYYLEQARKNITEANDLFDHLAKDENFFPIVKSKLYYKTLQEGKGPQLDDQMFVILKFQIMDPNDNCLVTELKKNINLSTTIPGFAHGIKGMFIGETREIFIHPSLAYGVYTLLDKGIYLKAKVTLLDIQGEKYQQTRKYPKLEPIDLAFVFDPEFEKQLSEENKQLARYEAACISQHYSKNKNVDIDQIKSFIKQLQNDELSDELTEKDDQIINKIHWNIYHGT